jgi:bifunctional non-homologous end joining protein LigD
MSRPSSRTSRNTFNRRLRLIFHRPMADDALQLDLCDLPLSVRKANLDRVLARRPEGIFVKPFERGEIGPDLFRAACRMGLEGLVSKRRDRPYQAGRSKHWVKVKNAKHAAMERVMETFNSGY